MHAVRVGALFLSSCSSMLDIDDDGLSNAVEIDLGTEPEKADTDDDGLDDLSEVEVHHSDPKVPDTDGDGLSDGLEVELGLDLLDPDSNGYDGDYPMLPAETKRRLLHRSFPSSVTLNEPIPPFVVRDVSGETVEIYDLIGNGLPLLFVLGGYNAADNFSRWYDSNESTGAGVPSDATRSVVLDGLVNTAVILDRNSLDDDEIPTDEGMLVVSELVSTWFFGDVYSGFRSFVPRGLESAWILVDAEMVVRAMVLDDVLGGPPADYSVIDTVLPLLIDESSP
jgi:hypothetical protein